MATTTYRIGQGSLTSSSLTVRAAEESIVFGDDRNNTISISPRTSNGDLGDEIHGGGGNDLIRAWRTSDRLFGDAGNDIIYANAGDDIVEGGDGEDVLRGEAGNDTLSGGADDDVLNGGDGNDTLSGDGGDDLVEGGAGDDTMTGGAGADDMLGGFGNDSIDGGDGDDLIVGSFGNDHLIGGEGNDLIQGGAEDTSSDPVDDLIEGGGGNDQIFAESGNDEVHGGADDDSIFGSSGADRLFGDDGNDELDGGSENDTIDGGAGDDLVRAGSGDDTVSGGEGADDLQGSNGADVMDGGDGNDLLLGGDGARDAAGALLAGDTLIGGADIDTADYSDSGSGVGVDLSAIDAEGFAAGVGGTAQADRLNGVENIRGSAFADILIGDDNQNELDGRDGDDQLDGRSGNDRLLGGAGADLMVGGTEDDFLQGGSNGVDAAGMNVGDTMIGGDGIDTVDYSGSPAADPVAGRGVTVGLSDDPALFSIGTGGDAEGDRINTVENIIGSAFADTLVGNSVANRLEGGDGNDSMDANAGDDILLGGAGNDTLIGDAGNDLFVGGLGGDVMLGGADLDTADYSGASAGVVVQSATISGLPGLAGTAGEASGDVLLDIERVIGTAFTDTLVGNVLSNRLFSGNGNDSMRGNNGADVLVSQGTGTKQLFGDGVADAPGAPPDGVDTYVVAGGSSGLTIILDYGYATNPAVAEDIVLPYTPLRFVSGSVGGQAALVIDGPGHDVAVLLNGVPINTAASIVNANLIIDPGFIA